MRTEVIKADTIDAAIERILSELGADTRRSSNRENTIYFDGWNGLGASTVLQAVAKRLAVSGDLSMRPAGLEFHKIIHIDCSKWESRRAMQRKIAEQLKLTDSVMEIFDKQDEEDDFNGLDQGSRAEIAQISTEIYQTMQNLRFLVILHNGGNQEIDIFNSGLSLYEYANSKMLWTFRGRFRLDPKVIDNVKKSTTTNVLLSASRDRRDPQELWSYLVRHEAAQISWNKHGHAIINSAIAAKCVSYMLKQSWIGSHIIDYNWDIHASNYWICDGIITLEGIDQAWKVGNALQQEVQLLLDMDGRLNNDESRLMTFSAQLASSAEVVPYWMSTTTCGFVLSPSGAIFDNMFQHSHMLGVLKISRCAFSFSSPPFLCCHSLRFLCLEYCQDLRTRSCQPDADKQEKELDKSPIESWECFTSLWVLDVRYTDWDQILSTEVIDLMTQLRELNVIGAKNWDMSHLRGRLRNIRKLRVTKSTCFFNNDVFSEMECIELLDFSGNTVRQNMASLSGPTSNSSLNNVIIDGCEGLKIISFRDCKELENLFLKGSLDTLEELDLSGTKVKTLDLGGVESTLPKRIILLGCEKLRAILWPESVIKEKKERYVLRIDTTSTSTSTDGGESTHAHPQSYQSLQQQKEKMFKDGWQISSTDARLLRSLSPVMRYFVNKNLHIDIYSPAILGGSNVQGTSSDKLVQVQPHTSTIMDCEYRDVAKDGPVEMMMMSECPTIYLAYKVSCILRVIMHGKGNKLLVEDAPSASTSALLFPDFTYKWATSLHVYDNSSITSIPAPPKGSGWHSLRWCRIERCPKLHTVFTIPMGSDVDSFSCMRTFWASQLLSPCYIWDRPLNTTTPFLSFMHLDHCPRLVHVLPLCRRNIMRYPRYSRDSVMDRLEILEIVYCSDLKEVFPWDLELHAQDDTAIVFQSLRFIHLHELPTLQRICGRRMCTPNLKTIKIRGCWSLRRLPTFGPFGRYTKPPKVDCEKEWWDNLEWDGLQEHHHPSLYEPSHSLYYKAQLPRESLLR
ncbi:uncharacterized protein LOC124689442 [Lolium rigidum]|uniref:uncharacterized protein LOC124689442 n=1 Tax=Lolium rigidum TaxID=89674 RepID=UPI001F5D4659|nr:uncharacterized protein LOC124689442 [Lolium rigidum]